MTSPEKPRVLTLVGVSGVGKTSLSQLLMTENDFGYVSGVFNRPPRPSELAAENRRITDEGFDELARQGRLLWDFRAKYDVRYGVDVQDIDAALADTGRQYVVALQPTVVYKFLEYCGVNAVRTMFIPAPPQDILEARMLHRGDDKDSVKKRLISDNSDDWYAQIAVVNGLHVATSKSIDDLHAEALSLMSA